MRQHSLVLSLFGSGSAWPDLAVAVVMALLALSAALSVIRQARSELRLAEHQGHGREA